MKISFFLFLKLNRFLKHRIILIKFTLTEREISKAEPNGLCELIILIYKNISHHRVIDYTTNALTYCFHAKIILFLMNYFKTAIDSSLFSLLFFLAIFLL